MTQVDREVFLPAQYCVVGSIHGNPIHQLKTPKNKELLSTHETGKGKQVKRSLIRKDGSSILLVDRATSSYGNATEVIYSRKSEDFYNERKDSIDGSWLQPAPKSIDVSNYETFDASRCETLESWRNSFDFHEEIRTASTVEEVGLRPPQVGALYAILAHWKVTSSPATVVMPTGTGKTETMLALLVRERLPRLLVVVPTNALREQVGSKFVTLGLLKQLGVVAEKALYPTVCFLEHKPRSSEEVNEIFLSCNVIVTTMAIAGQCEVAIQDKMADLCSHLFIDEAHHISAKTWDAFRSKFSKKPIVQFTATPFRNDSKHIDGKIVFNYPLRKAQQEGYFKSITFRTVDEVDLDEADVAIADVAISQLKADRSNGFAHVVMARCSDIGRAEKIFSLYKEKAPNYSPVLLHNKISKADYKKSLEHLRRGDVGVVVCVDMLGEGFDLPQLKIAAVHDPHKSLAITLQFTGRFTRTQRDLGDATMVANIADPKVGEVLRELYAEDADWNVLLRKLSQDVNDKQARKADFLDAFSAIPESVSLTNIFPKMSAVVYRTGSGRWMPERLALGVKNVEIYAGPTVNETEKVVLFITREKEGIAWGDVRDIQNTEWHLYLLYWNESQKLLFINSSNNSTTHEELAKSLCGEGVALIRGESVFRSLHNVNRLVLTNLGLSDLINDHLRFSLHVGSDISDVLPDAMRMNKRKSNLFGQGYENGVAISVGCSQKGRVWSMSTASDLAAWVDWCNHIGAKLINENISTEHVFKNVILPRVLKERPSLVPVLIDWPESFLRKDEDQIRIEIDGDSVLFLNAEIRIASFEATGPIKFRISTTHKFADYIVEFTDAGVVYKVDGVQVANVKIGRTERSLSDWFKADSPVIRFENGAYLEHDEYFELPNSTQRVPFDVERIDAWTWPGVDIKKESQKLEKRSDSIQRHVLDRILASSENNLFSIVFDDDSSGEAADIVCLGVKDDRLIVHLYHCKFSSESFSGVRVGDLYEVCGQAQRSVHWRSSVMGLLRHLRHRESARKSVRRGGVYVSRFERGTESDLKLMMRTASRLRPEFRVFIVQPGLSKSRVTKKQLELLAVTELYLMETSGVTLGVISNV